jgi:hypothetical protein
MKKIITCRGGLVAAAVFLSVSSVHTQTSAHPCGDLVNLKIENTVITEATEVPEGKPLGVPNPIGQLVSINSLPRHCMAMAR